MQASSGLPSTAPGCPWGRHRRATFPIREAIALKEHLRDFSRRERAFGGRRGGAAGRELFWVGQGDSCPAVPWKPAFLPSPHCSGPGHCKSQGQLLWICTPCSRAALGPRFVATAWNGPRGSHVPHLLLVMHRHMSGPRKAGARGGQQPASPTVPGTAGREECYLPVSLVVHGDKIHEEHVVSHRVHPEYLHLEGGEHAPGTERRGRRDELSGRGCPEGEAQVPAPSPAQGC